jgi:hypothetical protein
MDRPRRTRRGRVGSPTCAKPSTAEPGGQAEPCFGVATSLKTIEGLADEFETSLTATAIRYVEFSPDRCAVVFSRDAQIRWNRCSETFPYWLLRRGRLHGTPTRSTPSRASQFRAA